MKLYGIKTCDTCRKAFKSLENAEFVDVRQDGMSPELRARAFAQFGDRLLNTRSTTWRGLTEDERAKEPLALLSEHPTLMKRPLIEVGGDLYLGWTAEVKAALGAD